MDSSREERLSKPDADAVLVREVAKGSEEAIAILYQRHGGLIYRFSLSLSRDSSIAEEIRAARNSLPGFASLKCLQNQLPPGATLTETWYSAEIEAVVDSKRPTLRNHSL